MCASYIQTSLLPGLHVYEETTQHLPSISAHFHAVEFVRQGPKKGVPKYLILGFCVSGILVILFVFKNIPMLGRPSAMLGRIDQYVMLRVVF